MHFSMNTHISAIQCVSKIESAQQQSSLHKCKISELSLHTLFYLTLASLTGRLLENFLLVISFFGLLLFVGAIEHRSETKTDMFSVKPASFSLIRTCQFHLKHHFAKC